MAAHGFRRSGAGGKDVNQYPMEVAIFADDLPLQVEIADYPTPEGSRPFSVVKLFNDNGKIAIYLHSVAQARELGQAILHAADEVEFAGLMDGEELHERLDRLDVADPDYLEFRQLIPRGES
jgi:hypothetical protein